MVEYTRREALKIFRNLGLAVPGATMLPRLSEAHKPPKPQYVSEVDKLVHEQMTRP